MQTLLLGAIPVVLSAIGAGAYALARQRRVGGDEAPRHSGQSPLLAADDRWRDSWLEVGGARRPVAMRCAFSRAPWGCLDEGGALALVSPLGRNEARRATAQSTCAVELARALPTMDRTDARALERVFEAADERISELGVSPTVGAATAIAMKLDAGRLRAAHIGADRAYRIVRGEVHQLTSDHSLVARQSLPEIDALPMHLREAVTRVLGGRSGEPEVVETKLSGDEWLVLLSHDVALSIGEVNLAEMLKTEAESPKHLAETLVTRAYMNRRTGFAAAAVLGPAQA